MEHLPWLHVPEYVVLCPLSLCPVPFALMIHIELYGVPRLRAGIARMTVEGANVGAALEAIAGACPGLVGPVLQAGSVGLHPAYRLSLNGDRFVSDPATPLADGDTLLLLAADVGG
jgi:molybdopterin converting factor small subunit